MLSVLIRPFVYLAIRHDTRLPSLINWWVPLIVAVLLTVGLSWVGFKADITSDNGLIARVLGFVQTLVGFYIAALAAISTFNNKDMDLPMPGKPPTLSILYNGGRQVIELTRRRFLSQMFAYLTALSFLLSLVSLIALAGGENFNKSIPAEYQVEARQAFLFFYFWSLAQLTTITLWGLFYLGERIHTPDT